MQSAAKLRPLTISKDPDRVSRLARIQHRSILRYIIASYCASPKARSLSCALTSGRSETSNGFGGRPGTLRRRAAGAAMAALLAHGLPNVCFGEPSSRPPPDISAQISPKVPPKKQDKRPLNYTSILFVTDRLLSGPDPSSVSAPAGASIDYDNYFSNQSTSRLSLGQACVSFPIDRKPAEQTYASSPDFEDPAKYFALIKAPLFTAPEDFQARMKASPLTDASGDGCLSTWNGKSKRPLLFIHGWRTGFTAAITRAIQLKVDLDYSDVVVFTWPSDNPGIISSYDAAASGGLFVASIISSYGAAASEGLFAAKFVPRVLQQIR